MTPSGLDKPRRWLVVYDRQDGETRYTTWIEAAEDEWEAAKLSGHRPCEGATLLVIPAEEVRQFTGEPSWTQTKEAS